MAAGAKRSAAPSTMTAYSYRNGLREGVAFLLLDRSGRVLLECRPDGRGGFDDVFYPSGSIELKDHADGGDYREVALYREIGEEFRDGVAVQAIGPGDRARRSGSSSTSTGSPPGRAIRASTPGKTANRSAACAGWRSTRWRR